MQNKTFRFGNNMIHDDNTILIFCVFVSTNVFLVECVCGFVVSLSIDALVVEKAEFAVLWL